MTDWRRHRTSAGSRFLTCPALSGEGLDHAFTLRPEHDSAGPSTGPSPDIREAVELGWITVALPRQVHGCGVVRGDVAASGAEAVEADAVIVDRRGTGAAVATADCVGAILHAAGALAVIHAGWRGTIAGVMSRAIAGLATTCGARPSEMTLAMGPAIGRCCYEVGEDVADAFRKAFPDRARSRLFDEGPGRVTLDLIEANRLRAEENGIPSSRIHTSGICTRCAGDICWSWRGQGRTAARMWTFAGLRP